MASTYLADNYDVPMPTCSIAGVQMVREFLFTVATALVVNDLIKLCSIPGLSDIVVDDWSLEVPDLDTGATPAIQLQLGDTDSAAKFMAANTVGQAGGRVSSDANGVAAALPVEYTANKDLILKVSTAPQTGATAVTIRGFMRYHQVGAPSPV